MNWRDRIKVGVITGGVLMSLNQVVWTAPGSGSFTRRNVKDPYPLQHILQYKYQTDMKYSNPGELLGDIVKGLDIENNERYMKLGVLYKGGKAYEIPLHEIKDFNLKSSHTNTYCNIFTIDVLNIMANTTGDESYRLVKTPVLANNLRDTLSNSPNWEEVSREDAVHHAQQGEIVLMSYVKSPNGHIAFLRADSTEESIYMWNVGAVNEEKHLWKTINNTKYFRKR